MLQRLNTRFVKQRRSEPNAINANMLSQASKASFQFGGMLEGRSRARVRLLFSGSGSSSWFPSRHNAKSQALEKQSVCTAQAVCLAGVND